jgi:hypothetical protein
MKPMAASDSGVPARNANAPTHQQLGGLRLSASGNSKKDTDQRLIARSRPVDGNCELT